MAERFLTKLQQTDIFYYFQQIYKINADRVMKMQISMIHSKSGIQCLILFRKDSKIIESTKIIQHFATDPLCKHFHDFFCRL